jgi:hypothetical protein
MATSACWQATIVDQEGSIRPGASVEVRSESTGNIATIFSDRAGVVPLANPFTVGSDGLARFFVSAGAYKITATAGAFSQQWRYVAIGRAAELDQLSAGISFVFDDATADADPGTGELRFNNATPGSATIMYISTTAADVGAVTTWLDSWDDTGQTTGRGSLIIMSPNGDAMMLATVTGSITSATGYRKVAITVISTTGTFTLGQRLSVMFVPVGATGPTGATSVGKHTICVPASAMYKNAAAAGPSAAQFGINAFTGNYLAYDAAAVEDAHIIIAMPKSWDLGNISMRFYWFHAATTTNFTVAWTGYAKSYGDNEAIDGNSYAGGTIVNDTGGTTNNMYVSAEGNTFTPAGTPVANDPLHFIFRRLATDASDTLAIDAFLFAVEIYYTTNVATDA